MIDWTSAGTLAGIVAAIATVAGVAATVLFARRQIRESERAREEAILPQVHLADVQYSAYGKEPAALVLTLDLVNVGRGPAFGVRGYLRMDRRLQYQSTPLAVDVDGGGVHRRLVIEEPYQVLSDDREEATGWLWLEYRDLRGKPWATAVQLRFRFGIGGVGIFTTDGYLQKALICTGIDVLDRTETVMALDHLYIDPSRQPRDDEGIPWPPLWGRL